MARTMEELLNRYYESWLGMDAVYEKWAAYHGITFNMLNVLMLLHEQDGPLSQAELCRRLHLSKQTVASVIDSLEKRGIAERRVSGRDRRSREVLLTAEGGAFAHRISEALRGLELRALCMLPAAEREALVDTTHKLWKCMEDVLAEEQRGETE